MHDMPSRKERQLEKFEFAANHGQLEVTLTLYSNEAKYWLNRGGISCNMDTDVKVFDESRHLNTYKFRFNHPHLHRSSTITEYICGLSNYIPSHLNFGETLYVKAQHSLYMLKKA